MMNIPLFNQWDARWGSKRLGTSPYTMANSGCYVTSITMMLHNFAVFLDPGQVCDKLNSVNAFDVNGLLTYDGLMRAWPQLSFYERLYSTNDPSNNVQKVAISEVIRRVQRRLKLGLPSVLCVDNLANDGIPDHAVLLINEDWTIHDPDGGRLIKFQDKYGDPLKKLYGCVSVIGPPINVPNGGLPQEGQAVFMLSQAKRGINKDNYLRNSLDVLM